MQVTLDIEGAGRLVATVAHTPWRRLRGLLGRARPPAGTGLLIPKCAAIHTIGMAYPIDVVFLDADMFAVQVFESVPPGHLVVRAVGARYALEVAAGEVARAGLHPGTRLRVIS